MFGFWLALGYYSLVFVWLDVFLGRYRPKAVPLSGLCSLILWLDVFFSLLEAEGMGRVNLSLILWLDVFLRLLEGKARGRGKITSPKKKFLENRLKKQDPKIKVFKNLIEE